MAYTADFLEGHIVHVPTIHAIEEEKFRSMSFQMDDFYVDYINYSVFHNPFRKFPYYTASNIDGRLFKDITRDELFSSGDTWKKDTRIPKEFQLGKELYGASHSDFDRGHLTKRQDVQWGKSKHTAKKAAIATFYYTNAIPQVDRLNRGVWKRIEDYILHHETVKQSLKISLITGPLLLDKDPKFVTKIGGETVQIPTLFFKVVYYLREGALYRTGFLTSQKQLLYKRKIVEPLLRGDVLESSDVFQNFKDAETYQVRVSFIEALGNLKFTEAKEVFIEDTPEALILDEIDIQPESTEVMTRSRSGRRTKSKTNLKL
ncbi:DNA/RNA non-specific endonuclease [uncultured Dokdonia sp.]|uniref:DNA/RNA non-specific endonuclease n=1 Tax=uncultured Dokdonia sp. TaxID=575653 RepID=UPI002624A0EA|nr:DNA/RNA non-specific endonuclease [uncultured Dokdonia sp.]